MTDIRDYIKDKFNSLNINGEDMENHIYNYIVDYCISNNEKPNIKLKIFKDLYINKSRQIYHNIKSDSYIKNNYLYNQVLNNKIKLENLPTIHYKKLNPQKWKKYNKDLEIMNKELCTFDREIQSTDQFTCKKCKKNKCVYSQYQIRSSDEGITSFITCLDCGNNWREN